MKTKLVITIFLTVLFANAVLAQIAPVPPAPGEDAIKISTTLIQIDVTVTDSNGKVVSDLKPEEFEVYENGKKQDITNFSFITQNGEKNSSDSSAQTKPVTGKDAIVIPPVKITPEQVRRTYALVVDDLGLNFGNIYYVKRSLRKFVTEQMQDGDLVAILRTRMGIGALQSFTSDKRQLLAAIEEIEWNSYGRSGIGTFEPIEQTLKDDLVSSGKVVAGAAADKEFEKQIASFRNENFSSGTIGSLNIIIRGMRDLPGRKSILLFSEGFDLTAFDSRILDSLRILADLANRTSVVIYTLDPRGVQHPGMIESQDNVQKAFDPNTNASSANRANSFTSSQSSLRFIAGETGGTAFVNQNDLNKGLLNALADQNGYYLLAYEPDETSFDTKKNKFNNLDINVTRPGLTVRYRSGFFGVTDERIKDLTPRTPQQQLATALVSPFGASGINLKLYSIFYTDDKKRNIIRSLIYIDPNDLKFTLEADEMYYTKFVVVSAIFNADGSSADKGITTQTLKFTKEQFEKSMKTGIIYDLPVAVTRTGAYQFRIALQDSATGNIGAVSQFIEIPNIKKDLSVSGLILNNFTPEEWNKRKSSGNKNKADRSFLRNSILREFKRGTILNYDYEVYNPKRSQTIKTQMRLIRDGKIIYEEPPTAIKTNEKNDLTLLQTAGALSLGNNLEPGNYVLQIIITGDSISNKFATQFVEFEIIE